MILEGLYVTMLPQAACVLSFGPGDHSDYTARTVSEADGFVNLARLGFAGAADAIARMGVHFLFDLQVHLQGAIVLLCVRAAV